ncbi:hypothetical protein M758_7G116000 [Ceratodon purpureus]|uniref:1,3-beta-glucan synthase n=1 Tax=Ceratodon purpureus TaxID=3225 RepID=A0A8T0HBT9_CERPU|nr:hypothetical protein KC19_7G160500 [Ceratodon purpureus]KAG0611106.1 hypothetical protein M758_7G116000 [Ceratodon purpureus]
MGDLVYNIVPVDDLSAAREHPVVQFPEVRGAVLALRNTESLRRPPYGEWRRGMDILDWLGCWFGFQSSNVKNQREHLVLLLANAQMRFSPEATEELDGRVVRKIRRKMTKNYESWCTFVGKQKQLRLPSGKHVGDERQQRKELLYTSLYLLIWGEAANLRFMPECLCFIFHNMAQELNNLLEGDSARDFKPETCTPDPNGFLKRVVSPLFEVVKAEASLNSSGDAPHSSWRNYDDINEYFWSDRCFTHLKWPMDQGSNFLVKPEKGRHVPKHKVGKTGFVEQRSFFNIFRSFDRLWIGYILVLQACIVTLWSGQQRAPWVELQNRDSLARLLTIFITWSALRLFLALLDLVMQYSLISWETWKTGLRMILKVLVASIWVGIFSIFYRTMWDKRHQDHAWSAAANKLFYRYLYTMGIFVLPEGLALALFIIPFVRNILEKSSFKLFHAMTWWFQTRSYVGRGLREGLVDNFKYTLFWILVLASKFLFSYFLQLKPLIRPTKEILEMTDINYKWPQIFSKGNRAAVLALWAPVILIYFMDTQIWYTIWSALVGALVGLMDHLGEIRNVHQLKLRFQMFPRAVQFNLIPESWSDGTKQRFRNSWWTSVKNLFQRIRLRYGVPSQETKEESMEARRFSHIWNEILKTFREEDLISNRELELLEIPIPVWNISVFQWPSTLLANEVYAALDLVKDKHVEDKVVWKKISKSEYRRCAIVESYESIKHILVYRILRQNSADHILVKTLFEDHIDNAISARRFTVAFSLAKLPEVHKCLLTLVKKILAKKSDEVVEALQALWHCIVNEFARSEERSLIKQNFVEKHINTSTVFKDSVVLPNKEDKAFYKQIKRLQTTLETKDTLLSVPKGLEARRRISFFANSLFMTMPRAPQVEKMCAFSVLTPYYAEEVVYSLKDLNTTNEDGITTLFYLQKVFPDDWKHFKERFRKEDGSEESDKQFIDRMSGLDDAAEGGTQKKNDAKKKDNTKSGLEDEDGLELCLWASYRGQTLARTVRGMMYYERALECQAFLDAAKEKDLDEALGFKELIERASSSVSEGSSRRQEEVNLGDSRRGQGLDDETRKKQVLATAAMKFTYVVAAQVYGTQKKNGANQAKGIAYLLKAYKGLRIAYVDEVETTSGKQYFSVLVKYDRDAKLEMEIFRIQLPGPLKQGEGKPENQNHALIFTRGDAVQTIDMNQEMYFEEALKMRNLLEEFDKHHGVRKPTILGVREHVFTGSVSSLAWFMSAQETSFVTLGQRVLANPLKIRMHYGHPDVFNRLWFMSRGGISKASRTINISEDIFAGFNCTQRGGTVTHHEYIQAGKGRDVGLNQIAMFEAKVASGNGEQVLSRDVYRLGHRLDFFRMLSFYYTTVGFFINNLIVVLTVFAFLWGRVYLAVSGVEASLTSSKILSNTALLASLNQQLIVQLGIMTALPMIVENALEHGFTKALWEFFTMQLQLASVFFTFSMGTRAHYFGRTLLHGGAAYRATGRGFVVKHERFAVIYRLYSRSHFVKAIELIALLIIYRVYGASRSSNTYLFISLTSWFMSLTWIVGPFIFNPSGFDWLKTLEDFEDFISWLKYKGGFIVGSEQSWERWWMDEQKHLENTGVWGKVADIILNLRFFFFQYGIVYQLNIAATSQSIFVYLVSWSYIFVAGLIHVIIASASGRYATKRHGLYRAIQAGLISIVVLVIVLLKVFTAFSLRDLLTSLLAFVPTGWGILQIIAVLRTRWLEKSVLWPVVINVARLYEFGMGLIVLAPVAVLSWLPGFQAMQTRVLFNEGFSRGLQISQLLVTVQKAKKSE